MIQMLFVNRIVAIAFLSVAFAVFSSKPVCSQDTEPEQTTEAESVASDAPVGQPGDESKDEDAGAAGAAASTPSGEEQPKTQPEDKSAAKDEPSAASSENEAAQAVPKIELDPKWLEKMGWRSIGPANMSGRITDVEVHTSDSSLWWLATASGGLLKTTNRGTTIEHQFDQQSSVSIGAVASDPQNKNILWVGTGEINPRNSVSYGDGVYKSTDGGKTFKCMGLEKTYQIGRILVHPKNSNVVYVGAQGRLYGENEERGVYKTTDGGKTWEHVLFLDARTGVIDMIMHPEEPDTLIVAMWDRLRDGFDSWPGSEPKPDGIDGYDPIRKWGPKAGLYKTVDGGKNWKKLTKGLPTGMTGRIGLDWQSKGKHAIYAIIDTENIGKGPSPLAAFLGLVGEDIDNVAVVTQVMPESPASKAGLKVGDVLKSVDGQAVYLFDELLSILRKKVPGERLALSLLRGEETVDASIKLTVRPGTRGQAAEPFYGIVGEDVEGKIVIKSVTAGGPADAAGLKIGDVITTVDGKATESYSKWIDGAKSLAVGDQVELKVKRGDEDLTLSVKLGKKPGTGPPSSAIMGIQGEDAAGQPGAVLTSITEGGPSAKADLKVDDIVVKVADQPIEKYEDLISAIRAREAGEEMPVEIKRGDDLIKVTVTLGDRNATAGDRPYTYSYFGQLPNVQDQQGAKGYEYGGVYRSTDAGETWQRVNSINVRPMYFSVVKVDPNDDQRVYLLGVSQYQSNNGGVTFSSDFGRGVHSDAHDLWIDPSDGRHMVIGCDGGYYVTYDRGRAWDHINTAAIGQFYHVAIAPKQPYWVFGGLQDNGSWGGPAIGLSGGSVIQDWISVSGGDGFVCRVDQDDPDLVYAESQNGSINRRNLRTGERASIRPPRVRDVSYRFNWNTPFILSNFNSKIFYSAGNYVFRSLDRGNDLKIISPEITLTKRGSATALAESPLDSNLLYVGTDDGALWRTRDGGQKWESIAKNLGVDPRWVATIEPSRKVAGRVYVCLDAHRSDDDAPYVFVSEDYGDTFRSLTGDLPRGSSRCLREDIINPNLLYLGTEFAFWISVDAGQTWNQFNQELPTVAVHEVAMHPSIDEIVLATHGRSLWACDVSMLRSLDAKSFQQQASLIKPGTVVRWRREPSRGSTNRRYVSQNPASGARLWYTLPDAAKKVSVSIEDIAGKKVAELKGATEKGLHSVDWNLQRAPSRRGQRSAPVSNGDYRVSLIVGDEVASTQILTIKNDPTLAADAISETEYQQTLEEMSGEGEEEDAVEFDFD